MLEMLTAAASGGFDVETANVEGPQMIAPENVFDQTLVTKETSAGPLLDEVQPDE